MKGISPLVAAVILIAITITLAGGLGFWSSTFFRKELFEKTKNETLTIECSGADILFKKCFFNRTSNLVSILVENPRNVELKDIKIFVFYSEIDFESFKFNQTIEANEIERFDFKVKKDFERIELKTHCPNIDLLISSETC